MNAMIHEKLGLWVVDWHTLFRTAVKMKFWGPKEALDGPSILPLRLKFMECCIINRALSLMMKHLVFGQHQKAPTFSAFHWSPHGSLVSISIS